MKKFLGVIGWRDYETVPPGSVSPTVNEQTGEDYITAHLTEEGKQKWFKLMEDLGNCVPGACQAAVELLKRAAPLVFNLYKLQANQRGIVTRHEDKDGASHWEIGIEEEIEGGGMPESLKELLMLISAGHSHKPETTH